GLAMIYAGEGDREAAAEALKAAVELDPANIHYLKNYAANLVSLDRKDETPQVFEFALLRVEDKNAVYLARARFNYEHFRDADAVRKDVERVLADEPNNISAIDMLASLLRQEERYEEALALAQRMIDIDPKSPAAWHALGLCRRDSNKSNEEGLYREAIQAFEKAIQLDPEGYRYWSPLADVHRSLKEYDAALRAYNKGIELNPINYEAFHGIAGVHYLKREDRECIAAAERAIKLFPAHSGAFHLKGMSYYRLEEYEHARDNLERALELEETAHNSAYFLALIYTFRLVNLDKALERIKQSHAIQPRVASFRFLGDIQLRRGELEDAEATYNEAIEKFPNDASLHTQRAILLSTFKRFEEAKQALDQAAKLGADAATVHYRRGLIYVDTKEYDLGIAEMQRALALIGEGAHIYKDDACRLLGWLHHWRGDSEKAIEYFTMALELAPSAFNALCGRGFTLWRLGKFEEAKADLQRFLTNPDGNKAEAEAVLKNCEEAIALLPWLEKEATNPQERVMRARAFARHSSRRPEAYLKIAAALTDEIEAEHKRKPLEGDLLKSHIQTTQSLAAKYKAQGDYAQAYRFSKLSYNHVKNEGETSRHRGYAYNYACFATLYSTRHEGAERERLVAEALTALEASIAAGYINYQHCQTDSDFDAIRDHPRFIKLVAAMKAAADKRAAEATRDEGEKTD
ncbi:MAG: tetratricopeptide repeat protein, partial [Planctomycetes bacterium]|nr:tetratricopeptide repeat protein [Planctomycetota bacterium]